MAVFSCRLRTAAEDKVKKKLERERERERKHEISRRERMFEVECQGSGQWKADRLNAKKTGAGHGGAATLGNLLRRVEEHHTPV